MEVTREMLKIQIASQNDAISAVEEVISRNNAGVAAAQKQMDEAIGALTANTAKRAALIHLRDDLQSMLGTDFDPMDNSAKDIQVDKEDIVI